MGPLLICEPDPMTEYLSKPCTAFEGSRLLFSGPLIEVMLAVKTATERGTTKSVLAFDDTTGRVIDFDLRGTKADIIERLSRSSLARVSSSSRLPSTTSEQPVAARGRGRPKLGVIGREVTLLPRQWEWLAAQPGGASVALRKLVEEARRTGGDARRTRAAQERAYHFMSAMAGDLVGFEETTRALFANDRNRFEEHISTWPKDVRAYAARLAFGEAVDG